MIQKTPKPIVLLIFDGFGYNQETQYNAIANANTPTLDQLWQDCPHTTISGSGAGVGLPDEQMGNSEVGHMNLGAGRIVDQNYTRINTAIEDNSFCNNDAFNHSIDQAIANNKAIHILGLLSAGGVHSHEKQILAMLKLALERGAKKLYLHAFLDGRDTSPQSAASCIEKIEALFKAKQSGAIASLCGRYYAMDRDQRWERIKKAYDLLTQCTSEYPAKSALDGLHAAYERGETDEFVNPTCIRSDAMINDGDTVIFMNFRADRARQITRCFIDDDFDGFQRTRHPRIASFVCLTEYDANFKAAVAFPPSRLKNTLGEYLATQGKTQLRIAETEKYAHVTFFFNGGQETPFKGEDRTLIPSPKVATYDLQPEMSAFELTKALVSAIKSQQYDCIICNFANADMVGHTGKYDKAIEAIECLDQCTADIKVALNDVGGEMIITADHGNADCMYDDSTEQPHTAHTTHPVPFIYFGRPATVTKNDGILADIAPTMLYLLGLEKPEEMTGRSLVHVE